ncbi:metallophosphoesterase [Bacillus songklensis]|uniref:Phosphoesterase n=1 Tax=Bacillus songklensis TaxID=1069116 RepID=A0ABV8AYS5_9BACI
MKVLIISDSHGLTKELAAIKKRHEYEVAAMIHCGDSELPADCAEMAGFYAVRGNCDYDSIYVNERIELIRDKTFYITHGHLHNVKMSLVNLHYKARETGAHIVCFGHSHEAGAEMIDGILMINPGSILLPRMRKEKTYVILSLENEDAEVTFYEVDGTKLEHMTARFRFSH